MNHAPAVLLMLQISLKNAGPQRGQQILRQLITPQNQIVPEREELASISEPEVPIGDMPEPAGTPDVQGGQKIEVTAMAGSQDTEVPGSQHMEVPGSQDTEVPGRQEMSLPIIPLPTLKNCFNHICFTNNVLITILKNQTYIINQIKDITGVMGRDFVGMGEGPLNYSGGGAMRRDMAGRMGEGPFHLGVGMSTSGGVMGRGFVGMGMGGAFEFNKRASRREGYSRADGRGAYSFGSGDVNKWGGGGSWGGI